MPDGADPDWAFRSRDVLQLELARITGALIEAEASLTKAQVDVKAAQDQLDLASRGDVTAPPGSMIRSMIVGAGAAVDVGTPVAQWVDCGKLLVDVPLSDVEVALLRTDTAAEVVLEGEKTVRAAKVILTRGAAATLGPADLAAIAKGRRPGVGQAILTLERSPEDAETCAIGQAAYVDFPGIGLVDILRARLRL